MGKLTIEQGAWTRRAFLVADEIRIGRDPVRNAVVLAARAVSREHAQIPAADGEFRFTDLHSTNGSWLLSRGRRERLSAPHALAEDDEIAIGPFVLRFSTESPARARGHSANRAGSRA